MRNGILLASCGLNRDSLVDNNSLLVIHDGDCDSPGPSYPDMWRQSPLKPDLPSRSPLELSINSSYTVPGYDVEVMPNLLAFSPAGPPYKEYTVFKEKPTPEVTDALLSLKNAVVHPQLSGQLSPLSPTMHLGPGPIIGGGVNNQSQQPLTYTVNHNTQVHPMGYPGRNSPQFPSVHAQFHGEPINTHGHQQQGMFPAMSVNVSMSMNVVPPNFVGNQYNPNQQWQSTPTQHYSMGQEYPHSPQATFQAQCSPYSQNYPYAQSYTFTSDFRTEGRNFYYAKTHDDFKNSSRHYSSHPFKRSKFIDEKPLHFSHSPENAKLNLCRICGKTYARPSTLKTHLRTHSGEKPYKCSACSKSFSQAANLTAHIRVHSGEKPFHCPVCDRHFSQSSSVTTHMRTHSGERPYRCRLCKKAFSDSSTLTKHLRIHSGEKPYQCKLCLLRFSQSGNLNRHMRVHSSTG